LHITEAFMVYVKVAFITGLVISSPWVFYHIWMFIAAGLYPMKTARQCLPAVQPVPVHCRRV